MHSYKNFIKSYTNHKKSNKNYIKPYKTIKNHIHYHELHAYISMGYLDRMISPPETYDAFIKAELRFIEIDLGYMVSDIFGKQK